MSKIKIYIESDSLALQEVHPSFEGTFTHERKDGQIYYSHSLEGALKFNKSADYELLEGIADECEEIRLYIKILRDGEYIQYWAGYFSKFKFTQHFGQCWIEVKPEELSSSTCYEQGLSDSYSAYTAAIVSTSAIGGTLEELVCTNINNHGTFADYDYMIANPDDSCVPIMPEFDWCLQSNIVTESGVDYTETRPPGPEPLVLHQYTTWQREVVTTDCVGGLSVPPGFGTGWTLLVPDCGGSNTSTYWRCPASGSSVAGPYIHGRTLAGVLEEILEGMDCGLTVKSDFFGINPVGDAPSNIAYTFASQYCQNISVHQKSDVKRKTATNEAGVAEWTLSAEDFFEDLTKMFNVFVKIEESELILEH